jgi:hypothetical protein
MRKDFPTVPVVARFRGVDDSAQAVRVRAVQTDSHFRLVFATGPGEGASSFSGGIRSPEIYAP